MCFDYGRETFFTRRPTLVLIETRLPVVSKPLFEVLAYEPTDLGMLCLRRRDVLHEPGTIVYEVTLNHEFLMSSYVNASEKAVSEVALDMHDGKELKVLVGGLGLGYTAHAALQSDRVIRCDVIEFLPQVIDWLKNGMVPLSEEMNADSRVNLIQDDVYARLTGPVQEQYDLIIIDVDHSPDEHLGTANSGFYTARGLEKAKLHLANGGVMGVWSYAESSPFLDALKETFNEVKIEPVTVFNQLIECVQTDWLYFARD